jgi:hypothetical protein
VGPLPPPSSPPVALCIVGFSALVTGAVIKFIVAPKRRAAHLPPLPVVPTVVAVVITCGLLFVLFTEVPPLVLALLALSLAVGLGVLLVMAWRRARR